jgi:hypothetical protein
VAGCGQTQPVDDNINKNAGIKERPIMRSDHLDNFLTNTLEFRPL